VRLMGVEVDPLTIEDLNRLIIERIACGDRGVVLAHQNLRGVYLFQRDPDFRSFFAEANYIHIDGMALVAIGRHLGLPLRRQHRVTYVDWLPSLMAEAASHGWRVF
jgi:N-acetylglucosaminyldiphosphoundecaprenol N-acetyl-beta-D-mannosaminyltransferase